IWVQSRVDAALGGIRVGPDRVNLADDSDRDTLLGGCKGGALAGQSGANYENVMGGHERGCYTAQTRERSRDSSHSEPALAEAADGGLAEADGVRDRAEVDGRGDVGGPGVGGRLLQVGA